MHLSVLNLKWFTSKVERKIFDELGFCSVVITGPIEGPPLRIGWTGYPRRLRKHHLHAIAWTVDSLIARRVVKEVSSLLAPRRLRDGRYDVPVDLAEQGLYIAGERIGAPVFEHNDMLKRVRAFRQYRLDKALRELGVVMSPADQSPANANDNDEPTAGLKATA
ncbi:hypothetical protein [Bradyrhizobium sp. SZCCHNR1039]|uniref:hypothetical protein n=1 Tax=Bradyrhizobium sp. SZCCHNR1039 TaxID=3057350 RepID=UPI0029167FD2|nr:hypothetical protein [Bradyrhizobium sp. SZCCHNR1039]